MPAWLLRLARVFLGDPRLFLRYVSVGGSAALLELLLFSILHEGLRWPLLVANNTALAIAIAYSFLMQRRWTFRVTAGGALRQARWYLFMQGVSAVLNNLLMGLMVGVLGWYAPLAKVLQIGIVFGWNFSFCRWVVFRARPPA